MDANPNATISLQPQYSLGQATFDELMLEGERNCNPVAAYHCRTSRFTPNSYLFEQMYFPIMYYFFYPTASLFASYSATRP